MASFGRQVKSTATCLATSAGELADVTPDCFATAALACALASCTTSGTPALARFVAIGPPIVPRPMKPTRSAELIDPETPCLDRRGEPAAAPASRTHRRCACRTRGACRGLP